MAASSVVKTSSKRSCSRARPVGEGEVEALVDGPLGEGLGGDGALGQLCGPGPHVVEQLGGGHDLVDQADGESLVGTHGSAAQARGPWPGRPHQAGEALGAAAAGDDAEQDLGLAEAGVVAGDAQVAGQGQLAAAAERWPRHGGDDHPGDGGDGVQRLEEQRCRSRGPRSGPPNSPMSAPAAKMRSLPVTTTAPGGLAVRSSAAARSCRSSSDDSEFTLPFWSRTRATPSSPRSTATRGSVMGRTLPGVRPTVRSRSGGDGRDLGGAERAPGRGLGDRAEAVGARALVAVLLVEALAAPLEQVVHGLHHEEEHDEGDEDEADQRVDERRRR